MNEKLTIKDLKYLMPGDIIIVNRKPITWSDYLHDKSPMDCGFPQRLEIKDLMHVPNGTPSAGGFYYGHTAMTCGEYGWNMEAIVQAGALIVWMATPRKIKKTQPENIKVENFPFRIHKRNNQYYIKN